MDIIIALWLYKKGITARNTNKNFQSDQVGSMAIISIGRLCVMLSEKGHSPTGLGWWWSWIKLGNGHVSTRVICAYLP